MDVLIVLTNWMRPSNIPQIVRAFRGQSVSSRMVLVDNSPPESSQLGNDVLLQFDDVWRLQQNHGPPCRFAPALLQHDSRYILFYDDDCLPSPRAVENLLDVADRLGNNFSTIGQVGR